MQTTVAQRIAPRNQTPFPVEERTALPRLTPEQIRRAGAANPEHKASSYDGIHPRQFAVLEDDGCEAFASLWGASETIGRLPEPVEESLAPLIPKKQGGLRDLVLTSAYYRIGMRARRPHAQQWEDDHDQPFFASGADRAGEDAVWRAAVAMEAGADTDEHAAIVTQDMVAFFQAVDLRLLLERAKKHDFPLPLVRLATRWLYTKEGIADPITPNRGIAAGCSMATTLVKVY